MTTRSPIAMTRWAQSSGNTLPGSMSVMGTASTASSKSSRLNSSPRLVNEERSHLVPEITSQDEQTGH